MMVRQNWLVVAVLWIMVLLPQLAYSEETTKESSQEVVEYIADKLRGYEIQSENTYILAVSTLIISLLSALILYYAATRSNSDGTKEEGSKTREELSRKFIEIKEKHQAILHSNERIKDDTSELRRQSNSIHEYMMKALSSGNFEDLDRTSLSNTLNDHVKIINRLEQDNLSIQRDMKTLQEYISSLTTALQYHDGIEQVLNEIWRRQEKDASDLTHIKSRLHYLHQKVVSHDEISNLLDSYFDQLTIRRGEKKQ